jgi:hypothetical protein
MMRIDTASAAYGGGRYPGVIERRAAEWFIVGVVDGVGSWGTGVGAAHWCRGQLADRWARPDPPSPSGLVADIQAVVAELPSEFADPDFGSAFSVALVLARGPECHLVAAGAYGGLLCHRAGYEPVFRPRRWIDAEIDQGRMTVEEGRSHPLRGVLVGPFVGDVGHPPAAIHGPFQIPSGSALVIAEQRAIDRLAERPLDGPETLAARAVQALVERPVLAVVVILA